MQVTKAVGHVEEEENLVATGQGGRMRAQILVQADKLEDVWMMQFALDIAPLHETLEYASLRFGRLNSHQQVRTTFRKTDNPFPLYNIGVGVHLINAGDEEWLELSEQTLLRFHTNLRLLSWFSRDVNTASYVVALHGIQPSCTLFSTPTDIYSQ
ncbi:hypothetical protein EMCRGX_G007313 [Ephydatia muelleri]